MSARSISSTSSCVVWITTSTDSGILILRSIERESTGRWSPSPGEYPGRSPEGMRAGSERPSARPADSLTSSSRCGVAQADVQLAQLLLVDRARRVREQVLRALRLRERNHVAQRLGAG